MKKVFMFVNVDWFFISHRKPIAEAANQYNIKMSVYTDFTLDHSLHDHAKFGLYHSPLSRSSSFIRSGIIEFLKSFKLIFREKPDLIHAVTIKPIIFLGIVARLTKTPFIGSISGLGPIFTQSTWLHKVRFKLVTLVYQFVFSPSSAMVICQNHHDKNILVSHGICAQSKISIINGSGVDLEKFSPDKSTPGEAYILMASRILRDKGVIEFCKAAKIIYEDQDYQIKFKLAGPLDELSPTAISENELRHLCDYSNVEYLGNREDLNVLLASALIFVLPSYYPEGMPKVLLEATGTGTSVITTDHPGCRDAVVDRVTGILVEPKDASAIVRAISNLLEDPEAIKSMGLAGRKHAEKHFDQNKVVQAHFEIYHKIID